MIADVARAVSNLLAVALQGTRVPPARRSALFRLSQLPYRVLDDLVHELAIRGGVSHESVPMQSHVSRPVFAFQHQSLQAPLLAEGVIRGVAEKVVDSFLPYGGLHSVDDDGHASVKFARHVDRERILSRRSWRRRMTSHNMLLS